MPLLLTNEEVKATLQMPAALEALEAAYRELGDQGAVNRTRTELHVGTDRDGVIYRFKTTEGAVPGQGFLALRITSDMVSWPVVDGRRRQTKHPIRGDDRWLGLVLLFSTRDGSLLAIIPDGEIQRVRVGATTGLAVRYLARRGPAVMALLGTGYQAHTQIQAIGVARPVDELRVYSPTRSHRESFAAWAAEELGLDARPVGSAAEALTGADLVTCATNSMQPVFALEELSPGATVTSIRREEVDPRLYAEADLIVINARAGKTDIVSATARSVDIPYLSRKPSSIPADAPEVTDLVCGRHPGRTGDGQLVFFFNNTGIGIQFAAVAGLVYQRALASGTGRELPLEWFLQDVEP